MYFWLYDETPEHQSTFIELAEEQLYDQWTFNRVALDFVIQAGCPDDSEHFPDSPWLIEPEFNDDITHKYGAVGMGRDENPGKLSNGCQFYIISNEEGVHRLDGEYTVFGTVIGGLDVVEAIEHVETDDSDQPVTDINITVTIEHKTAQELLDEFDWDVDAL
ncbi:MAG: peptidylprolyl isomerase [Myxococcales bacterium FL481]|nr:MAG: peptidylprolyl isomerase [Myxococcales bacterium FL481]